MVFVQGPQGELKQLQPEDDIRGTNSKIQKDYTVFCVLAVLEVRRYSPVHSPGTNPYSVYWVCPMVSFQLEVPGTPP